jgi:hypothetical protein
VIFAIHRGEVTTRVETHPLAALHSRSILPDERQETH